MAGYTGETDFNNLSEEEAFLQWQSERKGFRDFEKVRNYKIDRPSFQGHPFPQISTPLAQPAIPEKNNEISKDQLQRLASIGVGFATLFCEHFLSHPCIVLRRQCQVHAESHRYHLTPFTIVPVMINVQGRQGISTMWKGIGSVFFIRGITLGCEDLLSKVTPLPKEISSHSSIKSVSQHLLLKMISYGLTTTFYAASLVETVQSDIASEKPGVFDVIKEGFVRLVGWGSPKSARLLPIWVIIGPTVFYGVLHYIISSVTQHVALRRIRMKAAMEQQQQQDDKAVFVKEETSQVPMYYNELVASFMGHVIADVLLYPIETVVHRIHLQGTRTIIDNLDSGTTVLPVITQYDGARDCFNAIVRHEGTLGLFKGFGALVLQYSIQAAILRLTKFIYDELLSYRRSR